MGNISKEKLQGFVKRGTCYFRPAGHRYLWLARRDRSSKAFWLLSLVERCETPVGNSTRHGSLGAAIRWAGILEPILREECLL